jgi:autotransporter-associated beta strand protein/probable HAF family extracellular repeat protein
MNVSKRRLVGLRILSAAIVGMGGSVLRGSVYSITDIGAIGVLAGGQSYAYSINNQGYVVGAYYNNSPLDTYYYNPVAGTVTDIESSLPGISGGTESAIGGNGESATINSNNVITTSYDGPNYSVASATYNIATATATLLPSLGGNTSTGSFAGQTNAAGLTVGSNKNPSTFSYRSVVISSGASSPTDVSGIFNNSSNDASYAVGVNTTGQITGTAVFGVRGPLQAYIASPQANGSYGSPVNIGTAIAANLGQGSIYLSHGLSINDSAAVVGTYELNSSTTANIEGFLYTGTTAQTLRALGNSGSSTKGVYPNGINNENQVVGSSTLLATPNSTTTHAFLYQNGNTQDLNNLIPAASGWVLNNAYSINDNGQIVGDGIYNGVTTAFLLTPQAANLTWNNSLTTGANTAALNNNDINPTNGITWDVNTTQNWDGGSTTVDTIFSNGDNVTFNDNNNNHYAVTIPGTVQPGSVTVTTANSYTFNGSGGIAGSGSLTKTGGGTLTLSTSNSYTGGTNVSAGTVYLNVNGALPVGGALTIGSGAAVIAANHGTSSRFLLAPSSLSISGSTTHWTGKLDLANNDLAVAGGNLQTITNQIKQGYASGNWNGPNGIVSSAAASNSSHLTALGVILNTTNGTTPLYGTNTSSGLFDGTSPAASAVLVRYTYYGDANLDGQVDGSDYALIDNGYLNHLTGWYNGDFNYDGVVDGSDYTLMDNAFNTQGGALPSALISPDAVATAVIAGSSAVPEPASFALLAMASPILLRRRRPHRHTKNK